MKFSVAVFSFLMMASEEVHGRDENVFAPRDVNVFTPSVNWSVALPNKSSHFGDLFYDPATQVAYVLYPRPPDGGGSDRGWSSLCAVDTIKGELVQDSCMDITPTLSDQSDYTVAEACYISDDGSSIMDGIGIVVRESPVGARVFYYNVKTKEITTNYEYEGQKWMTEYSKPAFSKDCSQMYYALSTGVDTNQTFSVSVSTIDTETFWQTDLSANRYAGFAVSQDGSKLYSAVNTINRPQQGNSGIFELDASNGQVTQEYVFDDPESHNAWTNVILDSNDDPYFVDDALGLVKFDSTDLSAGPVWSVKIRSGQIQGYYQPSFNADQTSIYASEGYRTSAVQTETGVADWNVGHASGNQWASSTIQWGLSEAAVDIGGSGGVYFRAGVTIQCNDAINGTLLWTYDARSPVPLTAAETLVINYGSVESLNTLSPTPSPSMSPSSGPTNQPSRFTASPSFTPSETPTLSPTTSPVTDPPSTLEPTPEDTSGGNIAKPIAWNKVLLGTVSFAWMMALRN